jgi:hypothetical protein
MKARGRSVSGAIAVVVAALWSAGCASRCADRCEADPCPRVWVPPHADARVEYCVVPAKTHVRDLPVMGLCRSTVTDCVEEVTTQPVEVEDLCTRLVPATERACLPTYGYCAVEDREDRLEPICEPRLREVYEDVEVPVYGEVLDRCGRPHCEQVGTRSERCRTGCECRWKKTGERLVSVPVGEHLERRPVSRRDGCVVVGEREATFVTGTHVEHVPVWRERKPVQRETGIHPVQVGTRRDVVEVLPWRYQAVRKPVQVPGYWATVCDHPKHRHPGIVLTRAEYAECVAAAKR